MNNYVNPLLTNTLKKAKTIHESAPAISLLIDWNPNYRTYELHLTIGKNIIILKKSIYLKEIEMVQREFEHKTQVIWEEVLLVEESNGGLKK